MTNGPNLLLNGSSSLKAATATATALLLCCTFAESRMCERRTVSGHSPLESSTTTNNGLEKMIKNTSASSNCQQSTPLTAWQNPTNSKRITSPKGNVTFLQNQLSKNSFSRMSSLWPNSITKCEASSNQLRDTPSTPCPISGADKDFIYQLMDPDNVERTALSDSHAVFGALCGDGLIERYNVYRIVKKPLAESRGRNHADGNVITEGISADKSIVDHPSDQHFVRDELTVVDLKLGTKLNGHDGVVHGGIISLLFDEAMGWAHECLELQNRAMDNDLEKSGPTTIVVTANLTVDFRAPFLQGSEAIVRVYHDGTDGRKIHFSSTLESKDGTVVYAKAKSLFVRIPPDRIKLKAQL